MNKLATTLAMLLCFTYSMLAQKQAKDFSGSLLWKISGKDITKPSYILGTHHFVNPEFLESINGFQNAFDQTNRVVGERDWKDMEALKEQVMVSITVSPDEKSYVDLLTEEEYAKLGHDILTIIGLPFVSVEKFRPMLLSAMLATKLQRKVDPVFNSSKDLSLDEHIQIIGLHANKKVLGLEGVEDQIEALFSEPFEDQLAELICSLEEYSLGEESIIKLDEYYKKGNLIGMYDFAFNGEESISKCPLNAKKKATILDNRNEKWLEKLPLLLTENSNFIAVGALHLGGEEGLLYQLNKMGYTVEAVK